MPVFAEVLIFVINIDYLLAQWKDVQASPAVRSRLHSFGLAEDVQDCLFLTLSVVTVHASYVVSQRLVSLVLVHKCGCQSFVVVEGPPRSVRSLAGPHGIVDNLAHR